MAACNKPETPTTPTVPVIPADPNAMKYTISNLTDMTIENTDDSVSIIGIAHTGGKQENLTLSFIDLPANLSATLKTPSGIPSFASEVTFSSRGPAAGTYPIKLKAVSASDSVKYFEIKITVRAPLPPPPPDSGCVNKLLGSYQNVYTGYPLPPGTATTVFHWIDKSSVKITNLPGYPGDAIAYVNCSAQTIQLEQTTAGSVKIQYGYGSWSNTNTLTLEYGMSGGSSGTAEYDCTLTK
jgi:hypothetical protein